MVNITDTFTRLYGRAPTQEELAFMMKAKADIEAKENRKLRPTVDVMTTSMVSQERSKISAANKPLKSAINVNLRGWTINCLLKEGLSKEKIAKALCITVSNVDENIARYKLPRNNLIKPR